jgi:hypothetical protein
MRCTMFIAKNINNIHAFYSLCIKYKCFAISLMSAKMRAFCLLCRKLYYYFFLKENVSFIKVYTYTCAF